MKLENIQKTKFQKRKIKRDIEKKNFSKKKLKTFLYSS